MAWASTLSNPSSAAFVDTYIDSIGRGTRLHADFGTRYQSKLFNPEFLREKGLPVPDWLERKSSLTVPYQ